MKRLTVVAVIVFLFAAAPAGAKGVVEATVCGADGCREVNARAQLALFAEGGEPTDPPSGASGWYRVRLAIGGEGDGVQERVTVAALPDQRLLRGPDGTWMPISAEAADAFRAAAGGLTPLPARELGLRPAPPARAPAPPGVSDNNGGTPWLVIGLGVVACLAAAALVPPVRRRVAAVVMR